MSHRDPEASRAYHRAHYARNAPKLRQQASHRRQAKTWCRWLVNELLTNWPPEPLPIYASDLLEARQR